MTLSVIGPGFGRTGTASLKSALEELGFGPCHHMIEVMSHPEQVPYWQAVARGGALDIPGAFAGYNSQIDWPGAHVWRELAAAFPDARVVLSVRPEEAWWRSFSTTIAKLMQVYPTLDLPPHITAMMAAGRQIIGEQTFGGNWTDRATALAAYRRRTADVRQAIPAERLLIYDVAEGWAPLCAFLGVPIPKTPFPNTNPRTEFWSRFGGEPA